MKKVCDRVGMMLAAFAMVTAASITPANAQQSVSLQVFYDELDPYGTWMDYGSYGYVWVPRVERDFVPYGTNGYWIQTTYGNTWVSDYSWGWAPFHYGRWLFDDFHGWIWVPDTEWAPAWVAWRSGGGYYGWAPLMPGIGIHLSFHHYDRIPHRYWNFVPYRYVTYRHVYRHCVPRPTVVNVYNHTTIITHNYSDNSRRTYFTGPSRHEIEKRGGGRVTMHEIRETNRPGRTQISERTAHIYKPEIDNSRDSRSRSIPQKYVTEDRSRSPRQTEMERTDYLPTDRSRESYQYNNESDRGRNRFESMERRSTRSTDDRFNTSPSHPRREYQPAQRSRDYEQAPQRTYRQIPQQRQTNARDRYEAPPIRQAPARREFQRRDNTQFERRPQMEEQNSTIRRREPATRERQMPSYRENSAGSSSMGQSQRSKQLKRID